MLILGGWLDDFRNFIFTPNSEFTALVDAVNELMSAKKAPKIYNGFYPDGSIFSV